MHKTDIREHGSGNAGTTNALRTFGKKAGAMTLVGDCLKCVLAIVVVRLIFADRTAEMIPLLCIYAAAGCILGHNFPITLGFRVVAFAQFLAPVRLLEDLVDEKGSAAVASLFRSLLS